MNTRVDDGALGAPVDDDARPDAGAPPEQQDQPQATTENVDARELADAQAALEAEEKGDSEPEVPMAGGDEPPAKTPEPEKPAATPGDIPYDRFKQVNSERQKLRDENLFLAGQVEALTRARQAGGNPPATTDQQPPPNAEPPAIVDQIKAHRAEVAKAAEEFDAGEITMAELVKRQGAADDAIAELNVQRAAQAARAAPPPPQVGLADQVFMEDHAKQLDAQYPAVVALSRNDLVDLREQVITQAAKAGTPFDASPQSTILLRETVAKRAASYAAALGYDLSKIPQPQTTTTQGKPAAAALSPAAKARLDKLNIASGMPPDTSGMGAGSQEDGYSDARIETMSDDDIAALPAAVRHRIMNR